MTKREARICEVCDMPVDDGEELLECENCGSAMGSCCDHNGRVCYECWPME